MNKNDIKKSLYKENPKANLLLIDKDNIHYESSIQAGLVIYFTVPLNDIGDAKFYIQMDAKLLSRYLSGF